MICTLEIIIEVPTSWKSDIIRAQILDLYIRRPPPSIYLIKRFAYGQIPDVFVQLTSHSANAVFPDNLLSVD